jgi:hypothetical protein
MRTFLRLLAFGSSLLVRFFFRTMKMMILMMMSILLTENTTAKEKKKKRRKRSSYFLTNTHTHTSLSLCVCVCVGFSLKTLSLCVTAVRALYFITSDEKRKKDILREKERNERTAHVLGLNTLNKKNRQKSLSGRKRIDAQQEETD